MTKKSHIIKALDPLGREYKTGVPNGVKSSYKDHITYCGRLASKITAEYAYKATCVTCRRIYGNL